MKIRCCLKPREIPGSNFWLQPVCLGSKIDFQIANLLLATPNFEPWYMYGFPERGDEGRERRMFSTRFIYRPTVHLYMQSFSFLACSVQGTSKLLTACEYKQN